MAHSGVNALDRLAASSGRWHVSWLLGFSDFEFLVCLCISTYGLVVGMDVDAFLPVFVEEQAFGASGMPGMTRLVFAVMGMIPVHRD